MKECLLPRCTRPSKVRGLCKTHYQSVTKMVSRGDFTWAELEANGKVLPPYKHKETLRAWLKS